VRFQVTYLRRVSDSYADVIASSTWLPDCLDATTIKEAWATVIENHGFYPKGDVFVPIAAIIELKEVEL
jgi:hypothetical protein